MDFAELTPLIAARLAKNERVRRTLPEGGRVRIDRQLPFLCVYREPTNRDDAGTQSLVTSEAAYLFASADPAIYEDLAKLCRTIVETLYEHFGAFLLLEIWAKPPAKLPHQESAQPEFTIYTSDKGLLAPTIAELKSSLESIQLQGMPAKVHVQTTWIGAPPNLPPLVENTDHKLVSFARLGLEIKPIYRSATGTIFPLLLQALQQQLGPALRKSIYKFTGTKPERQVPSYLSLGPNTMVKAARLVDQQLCDISQSFDFILQVTPVNAQAAWRRFSESKYERTVRLRYRPLPYHPNLLKRQLFQVPIERVEDVTLAHLFWEKQDELDRQLTALRDVETPAFLYSSLQLYGKPTPELVELAKTLLHTTPASEPRHKRSGDKKTRSRRRYATALEVADAARLEIDYYHQRLAGFAGTVHMSDQIASGLMVAKDQLLIDPNLRIPFSRVLPLLHHEIGTHLVTYYNGRAQPLQQLYAGLAGYEPLQEGLAVLAEYLSGGLSPGRLRQLAARVIAVDARVHDATFIDTFRLLHDKHEIAAKTAFTTTLRAYRGGGLTKDAIYLQGLRDLLGYLSKGHDMEPLYVGKIALEHIPVIQELRLRGIVQPPALLPRFWSDENGARQRLDYCRQLTVLEMLTQHPPNFSSAASTNETT
jgi:uncharacterized protein (TIGR02421 family)